MIRSVCAVGRALAVLAAIVVAVLHFAALCAVRGRRPTLAERARWLHLLCRRVLKTLNVAVDAMGAMPPSGLLVANHLSYLDIVVFGALAPAVFVAKAEVRSWPLISLMARLGGTIFIDRWKLRRLPAVIAQAEAALRDGALLVVFPESTTTDGSVMLPFRPALFEAAVRSKTNVVASHISYTVEDGRFASELCWWGEVQLLPHLARMFSKESIHAHLRFGSPGSCFAARKAAAAATYAEVAELRGQAAQGHGPASQPSMISVTSAEPTVWQATKAGSSRAEACSE